MECTGKCRAPKIPLTETRIDHIENKAIISLIRKINPSKATCSEGISGQTLL